GRHSQLRQRCLPSSPAVAWIAQPTTERLPLAQAPSVRERTNQSSCVFVVQVGVCTALCKICPLAMRCLETTRRVSGPVPKGPLGGTTEPRANAASGTSRFASHGLHR